MRALLKRFRYRLEWLLLMLAAALVPVLPRRVCFWIAQSIGTIAARLDLYGRRVARANLLAAFRLEMTAAQRSSVIRQSYQNFTCTMIDLLWSPRLTQANFRRWIDVEFDPKSAVLARERSCIFVTFHYSNFEWAAKSMGFCGVPLLILAQEFKNPLLDPIFANLRRHSGHAVASREGAILRLFKALKRRQHVAILTDLTLSTRQPSVFIECFGLKTSVTYAHAWLHTRTGAPIIPVIAEPLPAGRCRVVVGPPIEFSAEATEKEIVQATWDRFESVVRANPAPWLWMYKHWRYRFASDPVEYPYYANAGPNLETRLVRAGRIPASTAKK
ncbi:MAG: lysophospholipid acyltransferase family protein [Chthoniobacterales bacterium]|nr:lysophospholipid acyltransferase family protein [Chthoniobacterales bacterium]